MGKTPPFPDLRAVDKQWLMQRASVLHSVAIRIAFVLGQRDKMPDRREEILTYLYSTFQSNMTLEKLAGKLHLSSSHTSHLVNRIFNETLPHLINRIKMQEAARLLTSTDWPIGEIAWQVGFDDQNYFSRLFGQIMKKTPRAFRKAHFRLV
jgi:AraC-like DNA-binding protein